MMHKNFTRRHVRIFAVQHLRMKFYEGILYKNTNQSVQGRKPSEKAKNRPFSLGMPPSARSGRPFIPGKPGTEVSKILCE